MIAYQQHLLAERALDLAISLNASHFYVDTSVPGNNIDCWSSMRIDTLKEKAGEARLTPILHGDGMVAIAHHLQSVRDSAVKHCFQEIELASQLNAAFILHGGQLYTTNNIQKFKVQALDYASSSCQAIQQYANTWGVDVWLENLSGFVRHYPFFNMITHYADFERILADVPEMNIILDVGHYNLTGESLVAFFTNFHARIQAISLSDNDGLRDMHAPLGKGNIDWQSVSAMIDQFGWDGLLIFETKSIQPHSDYDFYMSQVQMRIVA